MNIELEREEVSSLKRRLESAQESVEKEKEELKAADAQLLAAREAQEILQNLAQAVQQEAHSRISKVVSSCLAAIFDDPYEFKIEFERKRGRTEARLLFTRRGLTVDPLTASGGGMVDVAAFALRVACLSFHRPRLSRVIVLDEPFRFVSEQYQENVRGMLEELAKDMKMEIIFVTHNPAYSTGKVIEI